MNSISLGVFLQASKLVTADFSSMSSFGDQQRRDRRAADILGRSSMLTRPTAAQPVASRVAPQASHSFNVPGPRAAPIDVDRISLLDPKEIANAMMHTSAKVREPVLQHVNGASVNRLNVTRHIVETLNKGASLETYQSTEAAISSLARIDLQGNVSGSVMPAWLKESIVGIFVKYFTSPDAPTALIPQVIEDVKALNLHLELSLKLLDWIDETCKSGRVYRALQTIQLLGLATPEIIVRILSQMQHFSPIAMDDLSSGVKEPSCLHTAVAVLLHFHDTAFNLKVLETINSILADPPVYSTRNHAPTQRRLFVTALLDLLSLKFSTRIRKFQEAQEVCASFLLLAFLTPPGQSRSQKQRR